ncbi:MAG: hypothetical protein JWM76_2133, partial [Pseudonocardiales bacterium]|nr:hypothetical protein [Pseudonocardiales bacterium]
QYQDAPPTQLSGYGPPNPYGQPAGAYSPPPAPPPGPPAGPRAKRNSTKIAGIVGVVVVLVAGLLAGSYFIFLQKDPAKLTFDGKKIDQPAAVLTAAEATVTALVKSRKGVSNSDTRCYYAVPNTPAEGDKKSDIDHALRCGPVLFVDGETSREYLSLAITAGAAKGGAVTLTAAKTAKTLDPAAVPDTVTLKRPDDATPPSGAGGLKVPSPPAADANFLGSVPLGNTTVPAAPATAMIGGLAAGIRLLTLGDIERYGAGDTARKAPDGQKLISFTVAAAPSSGGGTATTTGLDIKVVVGASSRALPTGTDPYVIAVPNGTDAALVATDGGISQSISLLDGKTGASNILVGQRKNHDQALEQALPMNWLLSFAGAANGNRPARIDVKDAQLTFWPRYAAAQASHPSSPANAFLHVGLQFTYTGPPSGGYTASGSDGPFGFAATYLKLQLPDGSIVSAQDLIPAADSIYDVFEVPAGFTTGTVIVGGAIAYPNGVTETVSPAVDIAISIAAG